MLLPSPARLSRAGLSQGPGRQAPGYALAWPSLRHVRRLPCVAWTQQEEAATFRLKGNTKQPLLLPMQRHAAQQGRGAWRTAAAAPGSGPGQEQQVTGSNGNGSAAVNVVFPGNGDGAYAAADTASQPGLPANSQVPPPGTTADITPEIAGAFAITAAQPAETLEGATAAQTAQPGPPTSSEVGPPDATAKVTPEVAGAFAITAAQPAETSAAPAGQITQPDHPASSAAVTLPDATGSMAPEVAGAFAITAAQAAETSEATAARIAQALQVQEDPAAAAATGSSSSNSEAMRPVASSSKSSTGSTSKPRKQTEPPMPMPPPLRKMFYGSMTFLQVLGSFGYRSLLLFLTGGSLLCYLLAFWAKGSALHLSSPYTFNVTFPIAPSLDVGVPLRMKGVQVGSVVKAIPGTEYVEAVVQVNQRSLRIPRSSQMVYNKAGPLSPAPFIEVQLPKGLNDVVVQGASAGVDAAAGVGGTQPAAASGTGSAQGLAAGTDGRAPGAGLAPGAVTARGAKSGANALPAAAAAAAAQAAPRRKLTMAAAAEAAAAGPDEVDACRAEGLLLCAQDRVEGLQGGGMDELTALTLRSMKNGVEDMNALPPVMRELALKARQAAADGARSSSQRQEAQA